MIAAGFSGDVERARAALSSPQAELRSAGLGALERCGALTVAQLCVAMEDHDPSVRRRAMELGATVRGRGTKTTLITAAMQRLADPEPLVVDAVCWLLGEHRARAAVLALIDVSANHDDARCREAAVAALGAIGDPGGLDAILARLEDRPQIRRRVVVALSSFSGPRVDAALERCAVDHDWQVRQAVELLGR